MDFGDYLKAFVLSLIPSPQIANQTVTIASVTIDPDSGSVTKVTVNGLSDLPVAVDWGSAFGAELAVAGRALVGAIVELHYINGQPTIAYSLIKGAH